MLASERFLLISIADKCHILCPYTIKSILNIYTNNRRKNMVCWFLFTRALLPSTAPGNWKWLQSEATGNILWSRDEFSSSLAIANFHQVCENFYEKSVCIGFRKSAFNLFALFLNKTITVLHFWVVICYLVPGKLIFMAIVLKLVLTTVCFMYQGSTWCELMFWATLSTPYVMLKDVESGRFFCDLPRRL